MFKKSFIHEILCVVFMSAFLGCSNNIESPIEDSKAVTDKGKSNNILTSQCLNFSSIQHCTLGNTSLSLINSNSQLLISGFQNPNSDGVQLNFSSSKSQVHLNGSFLHNSNGNNTLNYSTIKNSNTTSNILFQQSNIGNTFTVTPFFSSTPSFSGTYELKIFNNNILVSTISGVTNNSGFAISPWPLEAEWDEDGAHFVSNANGARQWEFVYGNNFSFTLSNSNVVSGNKLVITEQLNSGPNVDNSIDAFAIRSNLSTIILDPELTQNN